MVKRRKRKGDTKKKVTLADTTKKMEISNNTKNMTMVSVKMMKMMIKRNKRKGHTKKYDNDWHQYEDDNSQLCQQYDNALGNEDKYDG